MFTPAGELRIRKILDRTVERGMFFFLITRAPIVFVIMLVLFSASVFATDGTVRTILHRPMLGAVIGWFTLSSLVLPIFQYRYIKSGINQVPATRPAVAHRQSLRAGRQSHRPRFRILTHPLPRSIHVNSTTLAGEGPEARRAL
jgi:hypothetical protein